MSFVNFCSTLYISKRWARQLTLYSQCKQQCCRQARGNSATLSTIACDRSNGTLLVLSSLMSEHSGALHVHTQCACVGALQWRCKVSNIIASTASDHTA
eukprot:18603-Heterococcus_DN1.PRE.1